MPIKLASISLVTIWWNFAWAKQIFGGDWSLPRSYVPVVFTAVCST